MNIPDSILGFGPLGPSEMLIIFMLILLLFGAKRLPALARSIGKSLGEFRKAKEEFQEEITRGEDEGAKDFETKRTAPPRPRPTQQIATGHTLPTTAPAAEPVREPGAVSPSDESKSA